MFVVTAIFDLTKKVKKQKYIRKEKRKTKNSNWRCLTAKDDYEELKLNVKTNREIRLNERPEFWDCCERNFSSKVDFEFEPVLDFEESHLYWFIRVINKIRNLIVPEASPNKRKK